MRSEDGISRVYRPDQTCGQAAGGVGRRAYIEWNAKMPERSDGQVMPSGWRSDTSGAVQHPPHSPIERHGQAQKSISTVPLQALIGVLAVTLGVSVFVIGQTAGPRQERLCLVALVLVELGMLEMTAIILRRFTRRQHKAEELLRESEQFARSIVNALPTHIAILDGNGLVLATNRAWREFATLAAGEDCDRVPEGANYLAFCDDKAGVKKCARSAAFAAGIPHRLADAGRILHRVRDADAAGKAVVHRPRDPLPGREDRQAGFGPRGHHPPKAGRGRAQQGQGRRGSWRTWPRARSWPTPATRSARR